MVKQTDNALQDLFENHNFNNPQEVPRNRETGTMHISRKKYFEVEKARWNMRPLSTKQLLAKNWLKIKVKISTQKSFQHVPRQPAWDHFHQTQAWTSLSKSPRAASEEGEN